MFDSLRNLPKLLSVKRIWNQAPHNAFTDLLYHRNEWLCAFRESDTHENPEVGSIRLIASPDGTVWSPRAWIDSPGADLRDPKVSVMPDGRLLLLVGRTRSRPGTSYLTHDTCVSFSEDSVTWTPLQQVLEDGEWLWRLTWNGDVGYGVSYSYTDPEDHRLPWNIKLFQTRNGIQYQFMTQLAVPGYPSETTLRFGNHGELIALVRREAVEDGGAWIGFSPSPFTDWSWHPLEYHLEGPDFLAVADGSFWAAGRIWHDPGNQQAAPFPSTALCRIARTVCTPMIVLPSAGDSSYPGLVIQDNILWMSYYSTHEGQTAIYLAKIQL